MSSPINIFPNVETICKPFNGLLLDAYGVFWGGNLYGPLKGSKEAMQLFTSLGKIVGILSNSSQLASKEMEKLKKYGFFKGIHYHFLITSGEIAKTIFLNDSLPFKTMKKKFWLWGNVHPQFSSHEHIFQGTSYQQTQDIDDGDFIYLSIPHINGMDQVDSEPFLDELIKLVKTGKPMICVNPDLFALEGNPPRPVIRQGSIAKMFEELGGKVFYIGKPFQLAYDTAMNDFYKHNVLSKKEILMVGDTPETDIRGAYHYGIASALVTQTGLMAERLSKKILEDIVIHFPKTDIPHFYVERL